MKFILFTAISCNFALTGLVWAFEIARNEGYQ